MPRPKTVSGSILLASLLGAMGCDQTRENRSMNNSVAGATNPALTSIPATAQRATFAAGCFWGVEATFRQIPGVLATAVGYTGGTTSQPTYEEVCTDRTGHAEAVEVAYDPALVSYEKLLEVFWGNHDPTTPNRQGPDIGSQYRSAIYYHSDDQKQAAEQSREQQQSRFRRPIVTQIVPAAPFHRAEQYHQQYLEKRGLSHCHL